MYRHIACWMVAAAVMVSASAWAEPMSLWVGKKQTLFIFQKISKVEISNPAVVRVSRVPSVGLDLRAVAAGISNVKIICRDGSTFDFRVHATHGAEIYSTDRNVPEHFASSLSSAPRQESSTAVAAAPKAKKSARRPA